jgi:hypothetical protein
MQIPQASIVDVGRSPTQRCKYRRKCNAATTKMEMQGSLLTQDTKLFRMKCVQLMCKVNISALSLFDVAHQLETWAGATLGGRRGPHGVWDTTSHYMERAHKKQYN